MNQLFFSTSSLSCVWMASTTFQKRIYGTSIHHTDLKMIEIFTSKNVEFLERISPCVCFFSKLHLSSNEYSVPLIWLLKEWMRTMSVSEKHNHGHENNLMSVIYFVNVRSFHRTGTAMMNYWFAVESFDEKERIWRVRCHMFYWNCFQAENVGFKNSWLLIELSF